MTGRPLRRINGEPTLPLPANSLPGSIPAVRQLVDEGMELGALTVIVGENGAGKSTLVEAVAMAFGMSAEGGSTGARHSTRSSESTLHQHLRLVRGVAGARWGFFLRAETMHSFYTYLEDREFAPEFHEMSHGESFLRVLATRFDSPGLYVLDEPEAATPRTASPVNTLSFRSTLALIDVLQGIVRSDTAQAVVATHSPMVAATPGADLYEVGDWGIRRSSWDELALVHHWRAFMDQPESYLRHLR
ncbi:MAG: ATP-binding cassette domain-containing protein [Nakamurella sp.]